MDKIKLEPSTNPYPMSVFLVGANVNDKPNFMTVAWVTKVNYRPPIIAASINKRQYTAEGIQKTNHFSLNIPSVELIEKVDYCGIVSGRNADKAKLFDVFYGELEDAPMIKECPLCFECNLVDVYNLPLNYLFFGEVVSVYTEKQYLKDSKLDPKRMDLMVISLTDNNYWSIGESVGRCYQTGKNIIEK